MAGTLNDVTDTNFQAEVIEADQPVLVDFWAPWCGPCRVVAPVLEEIAAERPDLKIVKLNVDENQQTAATFQVLSIPTLILFKNGAVGQEGHRRLPEAQARGRARARAWPSKPASAVLAGGATPGLGGGAPAVEGQALLRSSRARARDRRARSAATVPSDLQHAVRARRSPAGSAAALTPIAWRGVPPAARTTSP